MAKVCEICGKSTVAGKRIQHHHSIQWRFRAPRSVRTFKPNLRKVRIELDGKVSTAQICMKCYKKLRGEDSVEDNAATVSAVKPATKSVAKASTMKQKEQSA